MKRSSLIHGCFLRDGIVRLKYQEKERSVKIFHMDKLQGNFLDLDFDYRDDKDDIFLNALQWFSAVKLLILSD